MTIKRRKARPTAVPMSLDHKRWEDFLDDLHEGCDFQIIKDEGPKWENRFRLTNPDRGNSLTLTCSGGYPVATTVLRKMGFTPDAIEQSISYFQNHGGHCDCEIMLNLGMM